jgi:hypothetical protein
MYHHLDSTKKKIIGRKFLSAKKLNESTIRIICEDGSFDVLVEGDCCSRSVFYDLVVPPECVGEEIETHTEGECLDPKLPEETVYKMGWSDGDGFECARIWDVVFGTKSGKILLRHANDSNGYYDGMTNYRFN